MRGSGEPLERLRLWLAEHGVDTAIITRPANIAYLTGVWVNPHERLLALTVTGDQAVLVLPALDRERGAGTVFPGVELHGYEDGGDPVSLVPAAGRLAVERGHITLTLADRFGARDAVDAGPELRRLRSRKSPAEIAHLDRAAGLTYQVIEAVKPELRPGMSELEAAALVLARTADVGGEPSFEPLVQFGPDSAFPHGRATSRRLAQGDLVLIDIGVAWQGYKGDISRTFVFGEAGERQQELIEVVQAAHDAAVATVRPGIRAGEVDAAARRVIEEAGYGDKFIHRTGHGLGLEAHEEPNFAPGDQTILEPGMVATVEPGIYLPGWGGIRIEDDVVVTEHGGRILNATP